MMKRTMSGAVIASALTIAGCIGGKGVAPEAPPTGTTFRDCPECPELVVVPAGRFEMGSPESESGRVDDEGPVHEVTIARPFAVGVHEVTRGEFARFVSATGRSMGNACWGYDREWKERSGRHWKSPGFRQADDHPVVCVSLGGRAGVCVVAVEGDGGGVPAVERIGVGVRGARGDDDGAVLGGGRVGSMPLCERCGPDGEAAQQRMEGGGLRRRALPDGAGGELSCERVQAA